MTRRWNLCARICTLNEDDHLWLKNQKSKCHFSFYLTSKFSFDIVISLIKEVVQ